MDFHVEYHVRIAVIGTDIFNTYVNFASIYFVHTCDLSSWYSINVLKDQNKFLKQIQNERKLKLLWSSANFVNIIHGLICLNKLKCWGIHFLDLDVF
jgi:hypothetical protein